MTFEEFQKTVFVGIKNDRVWKLEAYRLALFVSELCWQDSNLILKKYRYSLGDQLYRSVSSVSANIIEGYSRFSDKEKARFYEIALGSARESIDWYFKSRHILSEQISQNRIILLVSVIKLLQKMITENRRRT